jgi:selenocysteine lyase/cysteine desulfurase
MAGTLAALDSLRALRVGRPDGAGIGAPAEGGDPRGTRAELVTAMTDIAAYERDLGRRLLDGLTAVPGVTVHGITDASRLSERTPTYSITIDGVHPRAAAEALGRAGVFVWDGDFYAQGLVERMGLAPTGGLIRLGLVHYNTAAEVDRVVEEVARVATGAVAVA